MKAEDLALVTRILPALVVILAVTGICGVVARRVGQPKVVGEIVGGLLLGPSVFGLLAPDLHRQLFSPETTRFFVVLANIGLALYMFLVGIGIQHHGSVKIQVRSAGVIAAAGIVPAFALGFALGFALQDRLAPVGISALTFAIFLGCALSITALPVLARILEEQGLASGRLGSLLLTASAVGDVVAWCLLALSLGLAKNGGSGATVRTIAGAIGIVLVAVSVIRPLLRWLSRRVTTRGSLGHSELAMIIGIVLLTGWAADAIGVFAAFGGFVLGLVAPRSPLLVKELQTRVGDLNTVLILPIFFAAAGMNTYLWGLSSPALLVPLILIVVAACVGKFGCTFAARGLGMNWRESFAIGALMNTRGVMELVIAGAGLSYGLISQEAFSMLVVMTLITTALALPIARRLLRLAPAPPLLPVFAMAKRSS